MIVPDNATEAELGEEPEGFWDAAHAQVDAWIVEYPNVESD